MTNGMNPAPHPGLDQGWPQPAGQGQGGQAPQFPPQPHPGQPVQQVPGFDQNQFGGSRPFQQADQTHSSQITADEAENIVAQRGEKVKETDQRRSRIWRNILGVLALALLIACLAVLAWTYLPSPPVDMTTAHAGITEITEIPETTAIRIDALGGAPGQDL